MTSAYALRPTPYLTNSSFGLSFLQDTPRQERIDFHIASGDYFGTLATIVGLMADMLLTDDVAIRARCAKSLGELREDLMYLQEAYTITRKG